VHEAFLVETEAKPIALKPETEAKTKTFSLEAEGFEISTEARPSRGTTSPRDVIETEASRPRPHPCHSHTFTNVVFVPFS